MTDAILEVSKILKRQPRFFEGVVSDLSLGDTPTEQAMINDPRRPQGLAESLLEIHFSEAARGVFLRAHFNPELFDGTESREWSPEKNTVVSQTFIPKSGREKMRSTILQAAHYLSRGTETYLRLLDIVKEDRERAGKNPTSPEVIETEMLDNAIAEVTAVANFNFE